MSYTIVTVLLGAICLTNVAETRAQSTAANCANCPPKKSPAKGKPAATQAKLFDPVILSVRRTGAPGGDIVRGSAAGAAAGDSIHVVIMDPLGNKVQDAPGYLDTASGKFYVAFDKPLAADQILRAFVARGGADLVASAILAIPADEPAVPAAPRAAAPRAEPAPAAVVPAPSAPVIQQAQVRPVPAPKPPAATDEPETPVTCEFTLDKPKYQASDLSLQTGAQKITVPSPFGAGTAEVCIEGTAIIPADKDIKSKVFAFSKSPFDVQLPAKILENQQVKVIVWKDKANSKEDAFVFLATVPGDPCVAPAAPASLKIRGIRQDEKRLTGDAPDGNGKLKVCVSGKPAELTAGKTTTYKNGKFEAELTAAIPSAKTPVRVIFTPDEGNHEPVAAEISVLSSCYQKNSLLLGPMPKEGDTTIKGWGVKSSGDNKCAVGVIVDGDVVDLKDAQNKPVRSIDVGENGEFTANLMTSLSAGQCFTLVQFESGSHPDYGTLRAANCSRVFRQSSSEEAEAPKAGAVAAEEAHEIPQITKSDYVASALNLGRWRAYFGAGVVLAQEQGNFSSQHLFLGFNVDRNWIWAGVKEGAGGYKRLMLNTYFETRLTSIPVVGADGKGLDSFVSSQKAAVLQGGVYMPILLTSWRSHQTHNALSLGPIAKVGFETPVDNIDGTGTVQAGGKKAFYTFFGYGARLGAHRISAHTGLAPELLSYVDVVFGRYSSMDSDPLWKNPAFAANNSQLPLQYAETYTNGRGEFVRYARPWRLGIEGILKIPGYPFVIGMSANVHQNFGLGNSTTLGGKEKDDLRFFIGTRFDFGNFAAKLKTLTNPTAGQ